MKIAICDDNRKDLEFYAKKTYESARRLEADVEICTYISGNQLLFANQGEILDLILLDIHMPEVSGLELVNLLRKGGYKKDIIFLTESEDHMLDAFDLGAYNYIVKNKTSDERFNSIIKAAIESALRKSSAMMLFSAGGEFVNVRVSDIIYFEVIDHLITVHYSDRSFEFYSTIGKLEKKLEDYGFVRIYRSILVSVRYIKGFDSKRVILRNGTELPVSRGIGDKLRTAMEHYSL